MKQITLTILLILFFLQQTAFAVECNLPDQWQGLYEILKNRLNQKSLKMKLKKEEVEEFEKFLTETKLDLSEFDRLQEILPKTTIELIMSLIYRDVDYVQAKLIAVYLRDFAVSCKFKNINAFDNNTSHIIGRRWNEIDYSGEGMTWQKQEAKYAKYGITDFRTLENIKKFFPVESKLPYFNKIYQPNKCSFSDEMT